MSELTEMLKKADLANLTSYFLYGVGENGTVFESYEKTLEESYDVLFDQLEAMYPSADRTDNDLYDSVIDFAALHEDIYLEAGLLIGFQLYKSMECGYQNHKENDLQAALHRKRESKSPTA
ncbi:MAG: hypothetical protein Q4F79_11205 [Eubacteriales bacterium]|nr:hypothetical protein [Eubacteriales bacterium]